MTIIYIHLIISALAAPLYHEQIPMNNFFGFRLRKAMESRKKWFAVNKFGGRLYTYCGLILASLVYILGEFKKTIPIDLDLWSQFTVIIYFLLLWPIYSFAKKL